MSNTTMRAIPIVVIVTVLTVSVFVLFSCKGEPSDCPCDQEVCLICEGAIDEVNAAFEQQYLMDADGFQVLLDEFHQASNQTGSAEAVRPEVDLYFDRSSSMKEKIGLAGKNDGLLSYLLNVVPNNSNYFELTSSGFQQLEVSAPKIFVKIPSNFTADNNYAQLDSTIAEMARNNDRQSILITDGELAVKGQTKNYRDVAWARGYFTQWLKASNQIDFIIQVIGEERLFFILFTPEKLAGKGDNRSVIMKFIKSTENAGKEGEYEWLSFNINDYELQKVADERTFQERGINSTMIDWMGTEMYTRYEKLEEGYEHFHFEDREAFMRYVQDFADELYAEDYRPELKERNKLFYGLKLTNEFINYQIANLDLQVEDIGGPFQRYVQFLKCRQSRSVEVEDEEGHLQAYWCNPWADCADNTSCNYTPNQGARNIREIFALHEESTLQENAEGFNTADIAIKPSKNFQVDDWWNMELAKVGVYIKDVTYSNKQDFDLLKWEQEGDLNTGLSESIRLAMQELEPRNELIYTYYFTYPIVLN